MKGWDEWVHANPGRVAGGAPARGHKLSPATPPTREALPRIREATEHEIQVAFFERVRAHEEAIPELRWTHATPNGGKRTKATSGKLWAEGVRKGVADIHHPYAHGGYHSLWIELKTERGKLRPEQREFLKEMSSTGHMAVVCRSVDEAWDLLLGYVTGSLWR